MTYLELLRRTSVTRLLLGATVGRLPTSMAALALTLTLRANQVDFRFIGAAVAVFTVAQAIGGPILSRLVDRRGQTRVLVVSAVVSAGAVVAVAATPDNRLVVLAGMAVSGFAAPPLESCLRALWPILVGNENLQRAYSVDSVAQELIFVTGPLLVAATVAVSSPAVALGLTGLLCLAGTVVVATSGPSRQWHGTPGTAGWLGPLRSPTLVMLLVGVAGVAVPVGGLSIVLVSYAEQHPVWGGASMLFGVFAAGALTGALTNGAIRWTVPATTRLIALSVCFAGANLLVATLASAWVMAVICYVAGLFLPPLLVIAFGLVDELAPPGTIVEAFGWLITLFAVGSGTGSAIAGALRDAAGNRAAAASTACLALVGTAALAVFRVMYARQRIPAVVD